MKTVITHFRDDYQKKVDNIKWHIKTNGRFMSMDDLLLNEQRIQDFEYVIRDLNELLSKV